MKEYQKFIFESYEFDRENRRIELRYSLDGEVQFEETYDLLFKIEPDYDVAALDRGLYGLWLMAGVSYYKAVLPAKIEIRGGSLDADQAEFFRKTYRLGLGEFSFRNRLPLVNPQFPASGSAGKVDAITGLSGSLVPLGGGKDSIVTVELLKALDETITTWRVGQHEALEPLVDKVDVQHLKVNRTVSPELIKLNQGGALNGHIPISAVLSFLAITCAILTKRQNVVFSNEWSAGEGNMEYEGEQINHQYSKSFEFEREFQAYVRNFITPSVNYFSLLRPFSELRIAEVFCKRYINKYAGVFSSCNRNFHLNDIHSLTWCGECPKCAFVFLIFAPFLVKERLVDLFGGRNLFESEELMVTYQELLGFSGHKPFECVGEIQECRQAVVMARASGNYPELDSWQVASPKFDYKAWHPSAMTPVILTNLKQLVGEP